MPRKKTADIRKILLKRLQEPATANHIVDMILSFPSDPTKAKQADLITLIKLATDGLGETSGEGGAELPDASEDLTQYSDAQLWSWLRRLEGGRARGP